jgi:RNA polymerase sigma-70 factor, ECF subfamily
VPLGYDRAGRFQSARFEILWLPNQKAMQIGKFRKMEETSLSDYMDGLYAYAMVLSRNPEEAADLVQETYFRALKAKESFRPGSNLKRWLHTILRNVWLNQLRHERAAPKIVDLDSDGNLSDVLPADTDDAYDVYVKSMERERVRAAIDQLPVEFREILILREYEEISYQEIAVLLNCPTGTVMSRLARARSRLRELLSAGLMSSQSPEKEVGETSGTAA